MWIGFYYFQLPKRHDCESVHNVNLDYEMKHI
jgi:hypothetical protein